MKGLAELFLKKYFWENKRDNLYNQILWDFYSSFFCFLLVATHLFTFVQRMEQGKIIFGKIDAFKWIEFVFFCICLLAWLFTAFRNISACYYKLPCYRRKISEIDYQIVVELKKMIIN